MSTATASLTFSNPITDAEFRAACSLIANCLQTGGVTKVVDAGQIDLTTVAYPGSAISAGYEMRQFTDTLQATAPCYIKIEYGRVSATAMQVWITIGSGQNGSGTITGTTYFARTALNLNFTTATGNAWVFADTNSFWFRYAITASAEYMFSLERTVNSSKVATADGFLVIRHDQGGSGWSCRYTPVTGTFPAVETSPGCLPPHAQTTGLNTDGNVAVYPFFFFGVGETRVPSVNIVGAFVTDFTANTTYTVNLLGANQTMLMGGTGSSTPARGATPTTTNFRYMMKYQ